MPSPFAKINKALSRKDSNEGVLRKRRQVEDEEVRKKLEAERAKRRRDERLKMLGLK